MTAPEHDPACGIWATITGATREEALASVEQASRGILALANSMTHVEFGLVMPDRWEGDDS